MTDEDGRQSFTIVNRGFSGATTGELLRRIEQENGIQLGTVGGADIIVVAVGINDVQGKTPTESLREDYEKLLRLIQEENPKAALIVCTPYLLNGRRPELLDPLHEAVSIVQEVGIRYGATCVDLSRPLGSATLTDYAAPEQDDGIHPSKFGHSLIAGELRRSLKALIVP